MSHASGRAHEVLHSLGDSALSRTALKPLEADRNVHRKKGKPFAGRHRIARIEKFQAEQRRKKAKRKGRKR